MSLNKFFNDININVDDKKYLMLLLLFGIGLMVFMIQFHQTRGAFNDDIYAYLAGALELSGLNHNNIVGAPWIQNSPVIIFFTSLLFRLGFVDINSIFIVTGIFSVLGIFGMYVFLKTRFSCLLSFLGAILYSSLSLTLYYFANGMLDIPAVSMIIWTLIFTMAAVNKDYKYYLVVAIMFCISFFTRFASAYIIAIIALYVLKNHDLVNLIESLFYDTSVFKNRVITFFKSHEFKWIFLSVIIVVVVFGIMFKILMGYYPEITYFSAAYGSVNGFNSPGDLNQVSDKLFYVKNFLKLLSWDFISYDEHFTEILHNTTPFAYLIVGMLFGGLILKGVNYLKNYNFFKSNFKHIKYRNNVSFFVSLGLLIFLVILTIVGFKYNYLITLFSLWLIFIIIMSLSRNFPINQDNLAVSIMALALFSFYLVVVSFVDIKCFRYVLPAFPAIIYFVIYSLDYILELINTGFDDENTLINKFKSNSYDYLTKSKSNFRKNLSMAILLILIVICMFCIFNFSNTVELNEDGWDKIDFCDFIKEYDEDYQSKTIMGYMGVRTYEWYLNKDILRWGIDVMEFDSDNYEYIITEIDTFGNDDYKEIYNVGKYHLYERVY